MKFGIDLYIGEWISDDKYRLVITKVDGLSAVVSLFGPDGNPIKRPYFENKATLDMPAVYKDYDGIFYVHLWTEGSGFELHLDNHWEELIGEKEKEALGVGISRYAEDEHLDQYSMLFGNLSSFKKQENA